MAKKASVRNPQTNKNTQQIKSKKTPNQKSLFSRFAHAQKAFLGRRPHRSFRLTRRRDYKRPLKLPGNFAFTVSVFSHLKQHSKIFLSLVLTMSIISTLLVGMASQENFTLFSALLSETSKSILQGGFGELSKGGLLLMNGLTGSFSAQLSDVEQVFAVLLGLLVWLTTVWLLRAQLAGQSPRLRDGLYNAGAPIVSTGLVFLVLILQTLPGVLGVIAYNTAVATGALQTEAVALMALIAAFLLVLLSVYLITSTVIALVVVTLPGMYPWQALRAAGDLVIGRRVRILLRLVWLGLVLIVLWVVILVPILLFASWLQTSYEQTAWIPIVPLALLLASTASTVFASSYVYLLYRKVVDDDSPPA